MDAFKAVAESLQRRGCDRVVLFKQDKCLEGEYFNCDASNSRFAYSVTIDGKQYNVEDFSAVWYLKPHLPRELMTYEPAKYRQLLQRQFQEMRQAVWTIFSHKKWVNDPWQELKVDNKAFQLNLAVQTGFKIPDTLITSDPERVRNFFNAHNEDVIFKLLAASPIQDEVMYTNRLTRDFLKNIERIKSSPTIFQAYVPKAYELRITIAGDKIFPAKNPLTLGIAKSEAEKVPTTKSSEINPPTAVSLIASIASPFSSILCPGKTESTVSLSGAPKSIDGINERKELATAIETIAITIEIVLKPLSVGRIARIKALIVLTCIPGSNPLTIPSAIPINVNTTISNMSMKTQP